jgi:homocysteine S-methyltransferase
MPSLLAAARTATDKPLVAYPNGGDTWDATFRRWRAKDGNGRYDARAVASWTALGASFLGGCCGTGPADIAALAVAVEEVGLSVTPR